MRKLTWYKPSVKNIILAACVVFLMICVPNTISKYTKEESFNVNIVSKNQFEAYSYNTATNAPTTLDTGAIKISLDYDGYYAVIVKGGDGGQGFEQSGGTLHKRYDTGAGGVVALYGFFYGESKSECISAYLGSSGTNAADDVIDEVAYNLEATRAADLNRDGQNDSSSNTKTNTTQKDKVGIGGTNAVGFGKGTNGTWNKDSDASGFSTYMVGPGSGAASLLYKTTDSTATETNNKPNGSTPSNLIAVAGGAGATGSRDTDAQALGIKMTTIPSGLGGSGGSNIVSTVTKTPTSVAGTVFPGLNGTGHTKNDSCGHISKGNISETTYGMGGSTVNAETGGVYGTCAAINIFMNLGLDGGSGTSGGNFAIGTGGSSFHHAGPGGGGFAGGGGGSGAAIDCPNGGGGGGSSFLASGYNWNPSNAGLNDVFDYMIDRSGFYYDSNLATYNYNTYTYNSSGKITGYRHVDNGYGNGFVIVLYLGNNLSSLGL